MERFAAILPKGMAAFRVYPKRMWASAALLGFGLIEWAGIYQTVSPAIRWVDDSMTAQFSASWLADFLNWPLFRLGVIGVALWLMWRTGDKISQREKDAATRASVERHALSALPRDLMSIFWARETITQTEQKIAEVDQALTAYDQAREQSHWPQRFPVGKVRDPLGQSASTISGKITALLHGLGATAQPPTLNIPVLVGERITDGASPIVMEEFGLDENKAYIDGHKGSHIRLTAYLDTLKQEVARRRQATDEAASRLKDQFNGQWPQ